MRQSAQVLGFDDRKNDRLRAKSRPSWHREALTSELRNSRICGKLLCLSMSGLRRCIGSLNFKAYRAIFLHRSALPPTTPRIEFNAVDKTEYIYLTKQNKASERMELQREFWFLGMSCPELKRPYKACCLKQFPHRRNLERKLVICFQFW